MDTMLQRRLTWTPGSGSEHLYHFVEVNSVGLKFYLPDQIGREFSEQRSKMCSMMARRFVHLITEDVKRGLYALRNIDVNPLFAVVDAGSTMLQVTPLPSPAAFFNQTKRNQTEFFLLGSKIISVNMNRHTILYDTSTSVMFAGPDLQHSKFLEPAWAAVGSKLYLTNNFPKKWGTPCLEALSFNDQLQDWSWNLLPSPPFFDMPLGAGSIIRSYAAGDEKNIWISTFSEGTYIFDTTTSTWCKEGDWTLPFDGRVQYIPEYGLYFGFSNRLSKLCSTALIIGSRALEPPVLQNTWDDVAPVHQNVLEDVDGYTGMVLRLARSYLSYLGDGKFCVTRFYDSKSDWDDSNMTFCNFAVMTAVKASRDPTTGELQMIKGASRCYDFSSDTLYGWAL